MPFFDRLSKEAFCPPPANGGSNFCSSSPILPLWSPFFAIVYRKISWSPVGCQANSSNATHTVCHCYHLTSFAVLMSVKEDISAIPVGMSVILDYCCCFFFLAAISYLIALQLGFYAFNNVCKRTRNSSKSNFQGILI